MAKFCGKCGAKLDEQTGRCPTCDQKTKTDTLGTDINEVSKDNEIKDKKNKERKKSKKFIVSITVVLILLIFLATGTIGLMVYNEKLNIPYISDIFISLGIMNEDFSNNHNEDETNNIQDDNSINAVTTPDEEANPGDKYEVPEFDAEEYFNENTTLKSTLDVSSSQTVSTESEAFNNFVERGFGDNPVTYEYAIDGAYLGANEISQYSSSKHPIYQAYYTTAKGDIWMVLEINGSYFATPITYNFSNEKGVSVMISETNTITSYDSTTNKYYTNVPDESQTIIKMVEKINAETIEKLTSEEIDKL